MRCVEWGFLLFPRWAEGMLLLFVVFSLPFLASCKREDGLHRDPARALSFTVDTLRFDSVFLGKASATRRVSLRNHYEKSVRLERVECEGVHQKGYSVLMDGRPVEQLGGAVIQPHDSIVVVVRLTPRESSSDTITPCIQELVVHHRKGSARLTLYAQALNVTTCPVDTIKKDTIFPAYPAQYVANSLVVLKGATLTLPAGAGLYFAKDVGIRVEGSLRVEGTAKHPVTLAGERLETYYRRRPGQWAGVQLAKGSGPHLVSHARIRGAVTALTADTLDAAHPLRVENCCFECNSLHGIVARECSLEVMGSLFLQNFRHALSLVGSDCLLVHGTLYAETDPPDSRQGALVHLERMREGRIPHLRVFNTVLWGDKGDEIQVLNHGAALPSDSWLESEACLVKLSSQGFQELEFDAASRVVNPRLKDPLKGVCSLLPDSPARGSGAVSWSGLSPVDMLGKSRVLPAGGPTDVGALVYEESH